MTGAYASRVKKAGSSRDCTEQQQLLSASMNSPTFSCVGYPTTTTILMSSKGKSAKPAGNKQAVRPTQKGTQSKVTTAPLASARNAPPRVPVITGNAYTASGDGRIRVRHREFIGDVAGSVAFAVTALGINPGLATMFPWLSTIAGQFESYCFESLRFCFETSKSASTSGTLLLAVDYDAGDAVPVNKQQMMSNRTKNRNAVWAECVINCDKQDLKKLPQRFIRLGSLSADQDIKTYDTGNFQYATKSCADTTEIGELYVEYDVHLMTPQNDLSGQLSASSARLTSVTGPTRAAPFGTASSWTGGLTVSSVGATITWGKVGQYLVYLRYTGTVITDVGLTPTGTATTSVISSETNHSTAATVGTNQLLVTVNNVGETTILDFTASCTTLTAMIGRVGAYAVAALG